MATNLASTLLAKPTSLSSYTLHSAAPSPAGSPAIGSSSNGSASSVTASKGFIVGLWRVVGATHKTTSKDVSVWMFDKRVLDGIKGDSAGRPAVQAREWVLDQLKKEVSDASGSYGPGGICRKGKDGLKGTRWTDGVGQLPDKAPAPRHTAHGRAARRDAVRAHIRD